MKPGWFDAFFMLRPTLFFPAWTAFLAGYHQGAGSAAGPAPYLLWLAGALGGAFLINQLTDQREDRRNGKLLPLWGDRISLSWIRIELGCLILITLTGAFQVGVELSLLLCGFFLVAGVLYNIRPFRLKSRPILGVLACSLGGLILFLIGARAVGLGWSRALLLGIPYVLAGAAATLLTHVPDFGGDRACGIRTFATRYGVRATGAWALVLVVAALIAGLWLKDYPILAAAAISLPLFVRFWQQGTAESAETTVKISIFSLAVAVGFSWWPFLLMIALYYPLARWYHRARLGLDYPSFATTPSAAASCRGAIIENLAPQKGLG